MRRKLMLHGPSSMTVSLPSAWVKCHNLKKGDELDVLEEENHLLVRPISKNLDIKATEISFAGLDKDTWQDLIMASHKKGYDEIKISFDSQDAVKEVHAFLSAMQLGFEIIKQEPYSILVRSISNPEEGQFDDLFRRVFRITVEYSKKIEAIMNRKEDATYSCLLHETSINRISNYCKRILAKEKRQDACFHYAIVEGLSGIAHNLTCLLNQLKQMDPPPSKALAASYSQTAGLLIQAYNLYYQFSLEDYSLIKRDLGKLKRQTEGMRSNDSSSFSYIKYLSPIHEGVGSVLASTLAIKF